MYLTPFDVIKDDDKRYTDKALTKNGCIPYLSHVNWFLSIIRRRMNFHVANIIFSHSIL